MAALEVLPGFANASCKVPVAHVERRWGIDGDVAAVAYRVGKSLVAVESTPHFRVSADHHYRL